MQSWSRFWPKARPLSAAVKASGSTRRGDHHETDLRSPLLALCSCRGAAPSPRRRRCACAATIEKVDATSLVVKERSGETVTLALADNLAVSEVLPIDPTCDPARHFRRHGVVAGHRTARSPRSRCWSSPRAVRGTGEGHSPWDLQPGSTDDQRHGRRRSFAGAKGRTMTLHYKDGEKTIVVPDGVPVVTLQAGRPLAAGAGREGDRHGAGPRTVSRRRCESPPAATASQPPM